MFRLLPTSVPGVLLAFGIAVAFSGFADSAQTGKKKVKLDPRGEPKQFDRGRLLAYAVWHDKGGWHLQTTTAKKRHRFRGTVTVIGGTFVSVKSARLEKKGKLDDRWTVGPKRHTLAFDFETDEGLDGVTFRVSPEAQSLRFDLHIDGQHRPKHVFIGQNGRHPQDIPFLLPAHPGKKK